MTNLRDLSELEPIAVWDGIHARRVEGDQVTLAIVELDPNATVPEHTHPSEQNGMVIRGEMRFRVGETEVYTVRGDSGEVLVPAVTAVVKELVPAEKRMVVDAVALGVDDPGRPEPTEPPEPA